MRDILMLLASALLGGILGYWFSVFKRTQEDVARRLLLLQFLRRELNSIGGKLDPYNVSKAFYRDPIDLATPSRLLDGMTLEYRKDGQLIELLFALRVAVSVHNDFVRMANQAQALDTVPDHVHAQLYAGLQQKNTAVVSIRDELLKVLPTNV